MHAGLGGVPPAQCLGLQQFLLCILLPSESIAPPPDTTTSLMARYLLIKIWLPGNNWQTGIMMHVG